jgi:hypothetical protein
MERLAMSTPIQVTCARICEGRIERLGGVQNGSPWSMSVASIIAEIERPDGKQQWDFEASAHGITARVTVVTQGGAKSLDSEGVNLLDLPECPPQQLDDT